MKKQLITLGLVFTALLSFSQNALTGGATSTPATTTLIEKVTAQPGELKISYEKWRLPNGLTLIIHEDHSDPIAHVDVTYHVGSARETPGKSGFAHFFEHMMFQGSDHVADEEHMKTIQSAGGTYQGTTAHDRTNYYETFPKNYLETILWLESDRMGFLVDAVTQKKFEVQRSTVKNEKGQRVDNVPYGKRLELGSSILYPQNHPYNWPTIGYVEDLNRVDVNDLKNFFMRWYGPNNASIVVAGDVNPAEVISLVNKYFGSIPRGPEVRKQRVDPVRLAENVYANYGDNVYAPLMQMTLPTVPAYHPDDAALDILGLVLGNGNNSILYKNFVKSEKAFFAQSAHGIPFGNELAGEFTVIVVTFPGGEDDPEKMVKDAFDEFERTGVDDDALLRAKSQFETQFISTMSSLEGKASTLSDWNYLLPNKSYNLNDEIARYSKVTKEDVMRVFRQYIKGKNAAIVNIFSKKTNAAANTEENKEDKKAESTETVSSGKVGNEVEYKGLSYMKPADNFDRSKKPEPNGTVSPSVPKFYTSKLDNGISIIGTQNNEVPDVTLLFSIKGGNNVMNDPAKAGLASLTAAMMEEATQKYTTEQFSNELEKLGSSISFNADKEQTTLFVHSSKKNIDKTLELLEEKLLHPKFTSEDFKRDQKQAAEGINQQRVNAPALAGRSFARLIYGKSI